MNKKIEEMDTPLKKFLEENYDPHCKIVIDFEHVKVIREEAQILFDSTPLPNKTN